MSSFLCTALPVALLVAPTPATPTDAAAPAPAPAPAEANAPTTTVQTDTATIVVDHGGGNVTVDTTGATKPAKPPSAYVDQTFDIGLWPGLSLNAKHKDKKVRNKISLGFGWTRSAKLEGFAAGLGATVVDEEAHGVTMSLGANIARGSHHGVQATHGYNYAADLHGVQFGGINRAKIVHGLQAGALNIGGNVRGAQFGLINYAERADASFGLLTITKEGGVRPEIASSDTALLEIGLRLPARYTYTFFAAGLHPFGTERGHIGTDLERGKSWQFGAGFGGHIPVDDKVFIDLDLSAYGVSSGLRQGANLGAMTKFRAMVGWQAAPRVAIFAGPTINTLVDDLDNPVDRPGYGWVAYSSEDPPNQLPEDPTHDLGRVRIRVWPGFVAGIRF